MDKYKEELSRIEALISQRFYPAATIKSFKAVESGLKDLYRKLDVHLKDKNRSDLWVKLHEDFEKAKGAKFDINRASLGSMISFARHTKYWILVREMCDSNLRFVRMINWEQIRRLRNRVTHEDVHVSREDALEIRFWSKVFLYESGLAIGPKDPIPEVLESDCSHCNYKISLSWNFCPSCGDNTKKGCPVCGKENHRTNKVCRHCDIILIEKESNQEEYKLYKSYAEAVWADWVVTPLERKWLEEKRLSIGITLEKAEQIELEVIPKNYLLFSEIIEATRVDGKIDKYEKEYLRRKAKELSIPDQIAESLIKEASKFKVQKSAADKLLKILSLNTLF